MFDFRSPTQMAQVLVERGMEPSTVHSMVHYYFGKSISLRKIKKFEAEHKARVEKFRNKKLNDGGHRYAITDEGYKAMMRAANGVFVKALWRELNMIQRRIRANG